jgi:secondary thiamine-phosphate synthase enzyme
MKWFKDTIEIRTHGKGLYPFGRVLEELLKKWGVREGMCFLYVQHTSASLVIGENFDPSAAADMISFMERLAPEGESWYQHTLEGEDDSPAHLRAMITATSQSIPVDEGRLSLGIWQGIYLFEHRARMHRRQVLVRALEAGE